MISEWKLWCVPRIVPRGFFLAAIHGPPARFAGQAEGVSRVLNEAFHIPRALFKVRF
jgi:hypothetical protein